jgi:hypothetical protein
MQLRISRFVLPAVAGILFIAYAADVRTDYDHSVDFSHYHTYSWIGVKAGNSLWQDRIMHAVDSQLAAKGWSRVPSNGSAAVSAFGKVRKEDTLQTFYDGFPGWGWRGWGGMGTATTTVIPERVGTLTVDIFDGHSRHLIWRGMAQHTLSSKAEKNTEKLDHSVQEMFEHFPPHAQTT